MIEILRVKSVIEQGNIYSVIESIEEAIQICIENDRFADGLFLSDKLLDVFPYNSEYWLKKGVMLNGLFRFR